MNESLWWVPEIETGDYYSDTSKARGKRRERILYLHSGNPNQRSSNEPKASNEPKTRRSKKLLLKESLRSSRHRSGLDPNQYSQLPVSVEKIPSSEKENEDGENDRIWHTETETPSSRSQQEEESEPGPLPRIAVFKDDSVLRKKYQPQQTEETAAFGHAVAPAKNPPSPSSRRQLVLQDREKEPRKQETSSTSKHVNREVLAQKSQHQTKSSCAPDMKHVLPFQHHPNQELAADPTTTTKSGADDDDSGWKVLPSVVVEWPQWPEPLTAPNNAQQQQEHVKNKQLLVRDTTAFAGISIHQRLKELGELGSSSEDEDESDEELVSELGVYRPRQQQGQSWEKTARLAHPTPRKVAKPRREGTGHYPRKKNSARLIGDVGVGRVSCVDDESDNEKGQEEEGLYSPAVVSISSVDDETSTEEEEEALHSQKADVASADSSNNDEQGISGEGEQACCAVDDESCVRSRGGGGEDDYNESSEGTVSDGEVHIDDDQDESLGSVSTVPCGDDSSGGLNSVPLSPSLRRSWTDGPEEKGSFEVTAGTGDVRATTVAAVHEHTELGDEDVGFSPEGRQDVHKCSSYTCRACGVYQKSDRKEVERIPVERAPLVTSPTRLIARPLKGTKWWQSNCHDDDEYAVEDLPVPTKTLSL